MVLVPILETQRLLRQRLSSACIGRYMCFFSTLFLSPPPSRPNQKYNGQIQSRGGRVNAGSVHRQGWGRQERLIQQLVHDNGVLQRKVASFQVALRADESRVFTF